MCYKKARKMWFMLKFTAVTHLVRLCLLKTNMLALRIGLEFPYFLHASSKRFKPSTFSAVAKPNKIDQSVQADLYK